MSGILSHPVECCRQSRLDSRVECSVIVDVRCMYMIRILLIITLAYDINYEGLDFWRQRQQSIIYLIF